MYAVRNALQFFTIPVGYVLGGALVDAVFRPMMRNPLPWLEMLFGRDEGSGVLLCGAGADGGRNLRVFSRAEIPKDTGRG